MPDFTPNFALPYPNASDQPCDFDEQWCDFTAALDSVFATLDTGLARVNPIIPIALVRQSQSVTVGSFIPVPFDTVVIDTAGMTDIDTDPFSITVTRPGRYTISSYLEMPDPTMALNAELALLMSGSQWANAEIIYRGNIQYRLNAYSAVESPGTKIQLRFNTGGTDIVATCWWCVAWHSDNEVA